MNNNCALAMRYRCRPPDTEEFGKIKNSITASCRHYILGRACIAEKSNAPQPIEGIDIFCGKYGYSERSAYKFARFAEAIDKLHTISPQLVDAIIEGEIRLSMDNTLSLSHKEPEEIFRIVGLLSDMNAKVSEVFPDHRRHKLKKRHRPQTLASKCRPQGTVKDTPVHDPDSQMLSLSYTIPSWVNATRKIVLKTDLDSVSTNARCRLRQELVTLIDTAVVALNLLEAKR